MDTTLVTIQTRQQGHVCVIHILVIAQKCIVIKVNKYKRWNYVLYRTSVIIMKISPHRANQTPTRSGRFLLRPQGLNFIMTGVLYIISLITRLLAITKLLHKVFIFTIYLLQFLVLISREIVSQRHWCRLATENAGVDTCRGIRKMWMRKKIHFLDSGKFFLATFCNYAKIIDRRTLGRPIQFYWAFYSIKKSRIINIFVLSTGHYNQPIIIIDFVSGHVGYFLATRGYRPALQVYLHWRSQSGVGYCQGWSCVL